MHWDMALGMPSSDRRIVRLVRFVTVTGHRRREHGHDGTSVGSHDMAPIAQPEDRKRSSPVIRTTLGWLTISAGWSAGPHSGYPRLAIWITWNDLGL